MLGSIVITNIGRLELILSKMLCKILQNNFPRNFLEI